MDAQFTIRADPARDLIHIAMSGFFTPDDIRRFVAARNDAHRRLTCGANQHLTMADIREMRIQAQEIVTGFGAVLSDPQHRSRRLAFVVGSTLARMQVLRAAATRDARFFSDLRSAEHWLLTDHADAAADVDRACRMQHAG